jgi:hypothetical protein
MNNVKLRRGTSALDVKKKHLTRDDVLNYQVDWSIWHDIVHESMTAFDFDGVAYVAKKLNIVCSGFGDEQYSVKGFDLSNEVEHVCRVLIAMYELEWDEPSDGEGVVVYDDYCHAYKSSLTVDGLYHAYLKFKAVNDNGELDRPLWLNDPWIEVKLALDDKSEPWFQIDFNIISQSF